MGEPVLPAAFGRLVGAAHGVEGARDRPDLRIHASLQRNHFAERGDGVRSRRDLVDLGLKAALLVAVPYQGQHQFGAVGKVKIHGLAGDPRGGGDFGHRDSRFAPPCNQPERGIENPLLRIFT